MELYLLLQSKQTSMIICLWVYDDPGMVRMEWIIEEVLSVENL